MRIAMYTDSFYPYLSGVSTAVMVLAETLAAGGHQIFIQAPQPKVPVDLGFLHPNIQVHYVPAIDIKLYPDFRLATNLPIFIGRIKEFQPDIIHIHTPMSIGLEGLIIGKRLHIPMVHTFHTYYMDEDAIKIIGITNHKLASIVQKGGWQFLRTIARITDVTTAPSRFVLKNLLDERIPGEIRYCPNLLPESHFAYPQVRTQHAQKLLYVGRLSPEKRVDLLLESFALAKKSIPNLSLTLIGDGPERHALFDLSLELGIGDSIQWYGKVPHELLLQKQLYHQGDIFVTASRYETFGYTTLEAMAHGLPVIALACRGTSEIVGKSGYLIPDTTDREQAKTALAKKMIRASKDDLLAKSKLAFEQAKKYLPSAAIDSYLDAYIFAINQRAHKAWDEDTSDPEVYE